jgi:hypothetical protein
MTKADAEKVLRVTYVSPPDTGKMIVYQYRCDLLEGQRIQISYRISGNERRLASWMLIPDGGRR